MRDGLEPAVGERLDRLARSILATGSTPGLALAVTDRERALSVRCYGFSDPAALRPVETDTLFQIGSISKSFTAICLLRMVEAGRLDLHRELRSMLPWFPVDGVTPHHLLTHTGGLIGGVEGMPTSPLSVMELARTHVNPPGGRFWYSNVGYQALGYLLESLAGEPYAATYRRLILEPLRMADCEPDIRNATRARIAVGHAPLHDDRPWRRGDPLAPAVWVEYGAADGSVCAPAGDLAAYLRLLLNRGAGILDPASFALMTRPHVDSEEGDDYGYALDVRTVDGRTQIGHSGGMIGHHAYMWGDLDLGVGAVAFANGRCGQRQLAEFAVALLADRDTPEPDLAELDDTADLATLDAEPAAGWAGRCGLFRSHDPWAPTLRVATRGGEPLVVSDGEELPLAPAEDGAFRVGKEDWSPERLRFDHELDGRAQRALLNLSPYVRPFTG